MKIKSILHIYWECNARLNYIISFFVKSNSYLEKNEKKKITRTDLKKQRTNFKTQSSLKKISTIIRV